jgi:hypothetical protein
LWRQCLSIWNAWRIQRILKFVALPLAINSAQWFVSGVHAETEFIPAVNLSQRYDSNVFFGPFVPEGRQKWDLSTTVGTNLQVVNKSRLGDTVLNAGVNGSVYAYNTDLSFVSTSLFAGSDLSGWTNELLSGLKVQVSDSFLYTPESPAFLTGGRAADASDVFSRGIQTVRANTFRNTFAAGGTYSFTRSLGLRTDYSFSIYRYGNFISTVPTGSPVAFFDSTLHTIAAGPTYQMEGGDTLFMRYGYTTVSTSGEGEFKGVNLNFASHTLQPEYVTRRLPGYTVTISGGGTVVEQGGGSQAFFSGRLALATEYDRRTQVQISISRRAAPAFIGSGGALISSLAQLNVNHGLSKLLRLSVAGGYAYNETTPVRVFTFTSYTASAMLEYKVTRSTFLSLSQEYYRFSYTGILPFERHVTMLMLRTEWK